MIQPVHITVAPFPAQERTPEFGVLGAPKTGVDFSSAELHIMYPLCPKSQKCARGFQRPRCFESPCTRTRRGYSLLCHTHTYTRHDPERRHSAASKRCMAVTSVQGAPYSVAVAQCSPWGRGAMTGAQGATCTTQALRARSSGRRAARLILSPLQAGTVQPLGVQSHNRRTGCAISCRRYRHAILRFR